MKKIILSVTAFAVIGLALLSCEKEETAIKDVSTKSSSMESSVKSKQNFDKSLNNFENPYEFVGEIHNIVLDDVISHPNFPWMNVDDKALIISARLMQELSQRGLSADQKNHVLDTEMREIVNKMPNDEVLWTKMIDESEKMGKAIVQNIKTELKNYNSHKNYGLTIANLKQLEKNVNFNNAISSDDKTFYLSLLALGRNTFSFWRLKYINGGEDFDNDRTPYASDISGFFHGWRKARREGGSFSDAFDMGMFWADTYSARP